MSNCEKTAKSGQSCTSNCSKTKFGKSQEIWYTVVTTVVLPLIFSHGGSNFFLYAKPFLKTEKNRMDKYFEF